MTPQEAIEAAGTRGGGDPLPPAVARRCTGRYREAEADMAARWHELARAAVRWTGQADLGGRRWAPWRP